MMSTTSPSNAKKHSPISKSENKMIQLIQNQFEEYMHQADQFQQQLHEHLQLTSKHLLYEKDNKTTLNDPQENKVEVNPPNEFERNLSKILLDTQPISFKSESLRAFGKLIQTANTEFKRGTALVLLRNNLIISDVESSMKEFCSKRFLKILKKWLQEAFQLCQNDLVSLLIDTLAQLPFDINDIVALKLNDLMIKLKKSTDQNHIKTSTSKILKVWKTKFNEIAMTTNASPSTSMNDEKDKSTPMKPEVVFTTRKTSNSSDVLGSLLANTGKPVAKKAVPSRITQTPASVDSTVIKPSVPVALPTIESFSSRTNEGKKRIRWADNEGKQLLHIKFIEPVKNGMMTFEEAKNLEHKNERIQIVSESRSNKLKAIKPTIGWKTPSLSMITNPQTQLPEINRITAEYVAQGVRTKHEMETIFLINEEPPHTPVDWVPTKKELISHDPLVVPLYINGKVEVDERVAYQQEKTQNKGTDGLLPTSFQDLPSSAIGLLLRHQELIPIVTKEAKQGTITAERIQELVHNKQMAQNIKQDAPYCSFFNSNSGCTKGNSCTFKHEILPSTAMSQVSKKRKKQRGDGQAKIARR